ncbi:nucleotidyltransferase domain-containing protein [Streptomyces massasporeus]
MARQDNGPVLRSERRPTVTVPNILLSGIVGSTAYGLARPGSDIDRLGLFAVPTDELHGLRTPKESHVSTAPDRTLHEAAKWCRLALGGNPTAMELVWLADDLYEVRTPLGDELIGIRTAFLCAKRVRDAYLGYATQQFRRLEARGDGSFSADRRNRTAKHARHLKRLCAQGLELYTTGRLAIRVEDPEEYHAFGERVAADPSVALPLLRHYENAFDEGPTVLPDEPDEAPVEAWLRRVRAHFLDGAQTSAVGA